ncbi:GNAT family N-acetyltransferase [Sporolactobacillus sp. CPB3-1]|uniref:GNAT family N-acetyltransferase n=1 Tax=Sporolactobacillus mangiferae TaxID=2940498 RepID=A0ABT0MBD0_9BACL|nr:GNAT family N-acetyltransferase [Sporolactobacillus mangiferae]MCL1632167.1 GNAT family N-acetyltransferase [Sporolactobacillus mangiferae]
MVMEWKELDAEYIDDYLDLLSCLDVRNRLSADQAWQLLHQVTQYPYYKILCLFDHAELTATYSLIILDNFGHGGKKIALIENVVVAEATRGQGIGRKMMEDAMKRAAANHCYKLMLSSDLKRTGAHAFYETLGFDQHGLSFRVEVPAHD